MALSKPIIDTNRIAAFDATIGTTIYYSIIGGDTPTRNRVTVVDTNGDICYRSSWVSTFNNYCSIPANASYSGRALINGNPYFVYVETGDANNVSPQSNQVQVYCYTTPTFEFVDAPSTVPSSTYNFQAKYKQIENEKLNTYIFTLYNVENVAIATSGELYAAQLPLSDTYILSYVFSGLLDGQTFKIGLQGVTVNNTKLTIEPQQFVVSYTQEETKGEMTLTNNCKTGVVEVASSLDVHNGVPFKDVVYINDDEVDLRNNIVEWLDVETQDNFTIRTIFRVAALTQYDSITILQSQTNIGAPYFSVTYLYDPTTKANSCRLSDYTTSPSTVVNSNVLYGIPNDLTKFVLQIRRNNNQWSVQIAVYDQPTPTLYTNENDDVYVSYVGTTKPPIEYSIINFDDANLLGDCVGYHRDQISGTWQYSSSHICPDGYPQYTYAAKSSDSEIEISAIPQGGSKGSAKISVTPALNNTHKYYFCAYLYQETPNGSFDFYWPINEPAILAGATVSAAKTWTKVSALVDRSTFANGNYACRMDYNNPSNIYMYISGLTLIDLTESFGAGYEPNKEFCDKYLGYNIDDLSALIAAYDTSVIQPSFNYDTNNGDIKITI